MQVIAGAGRYTAPNDGEPNHWVVHLTTDDLSVGTYSIPDGGLDDQTTHHEDEIYVVRAGTATLVTDSGSAEVGPGAVIFVPPGEKHVFTDVRGDFAVLGIFAPPYLSRQPAR
jgi:mannose-6-phosphate isomerase-like protein (cupin superfamily)